MLGRYRLDARLGSGGVGEVWRAHDTDLDRVVALKLLQAHIQNDPDAVARFHREARMAARLRHRNIVRVHAFGEIDGRLYLDMELVEGADLQSVLSAEGPLAIPRVLRIVEQLAGALDAAHALDEPAAHRMVHRDVKPAKVLLEPGRGAEPEHVYLADFGVARAVLGGTSLTRPGQVNGTPAYMAPELWKAAASDHRVDVYALAVLLFEMVTGQLPYRRDSVWAIMEAHTNGRVPRPSERDPDLPAAFDEVIARGLAKDPQDRYQRAGELAAEARAALAGPTPNRAPSPSPPPAPNPVAGPQTRRLPATDAPPRSPAQPVVPGGPSAPHSPIPLPGTSFVGTRAHFVGLGCAALVVPLDLLGWFSGGAMALLYLVVLYGLGALAGLWLPGRR